MRYRPGDFAVDEILGFQPDGEGPHTLLLIRKSGANSDWVARRLAREAGVAARDVGFCGMKDRNAVTTQWFSLPGSPNLDFSQLAADGIELLERACHRRKLRRGSHRGNRFRLCLRDLEGDVPEIERRLTRIAECGVPNYFGEQRFGHGGGNLGLARALAAGVRLDRRRRGFALSAARSAIFNEVLSRRVARRTWDQIHAGDLAVLDGTGSRFPVEHVDDDLRSRSSRLDLHPTGPLWGEGDPPCAGEILALELAVAGEMPEMVAAVVGAAMDHDRRSLRLPVSDFDWEISGRELTLVFRLHRGAFATAVLRELIGSETSHADQGAARNST
jgi:tRNA pseudouridine13 synthase